MCVCPAPRLHRTHPGVLQAAPPRAAAPGTQAAAEAALPADAAGGRSEAAGWSPTQPHWDVPQQVSKSWKDAATLASGIAGSKRTRAFNSRSIQRLEEMNVGIDHRGDEGMTHVGQQWNGPTSNPRIPSTRHASDKGNPSGGVSSNTPLGSGNQDFPSLAETPLPTSHR